MPTHRYPAYLQLTVLILLLVLLSFSQPATLPALAAGTTYYVAPTGSNSNPGTAAEPWLTLQHAADTVTAGDTVLVATGAYNETVEITVSGTDADPIRVQAADGANPEVRGFILDGDYLAISGFTVRVFACGPASYGIEVQGSHIGISDNQFIETVDAGVYTSSASSDVLISGNYFYHNVQTSIQLHGTGHRIENNEIRRPIQDHPVCNVRTDDANGIWYFGSGHVIRENWIHEVWYGEYVRDAHMDCVQTYRGWEAGDPERNTNVLIENNTCEANSWQTPDENGGGFTHEDVSSSDGTYAGGIILRNNVVIAPQCAAAQPDSAYITFVNNTCITDLALVNNDTSALDFWPSTAYDNHHYFLQNNIFYNYRHQWYLGDTVVATGTVTLGYNLSYRTDGNNTTAKYFDCATEHNLCADPGFINPDGGDYHLGETSPAVNVGALLTDLVLVDHDGIPRPQGTGYDIGAYEVVADRVETELLANGGMETDTEPDKLPDGWTLTSTTGRAGKLRCNQDGNNDGDTDDPEDKVVAHGGTCAFVFRGNPGRQGTLKQVPDLTALTFSSGDLLTLRVWSAASLTGTTATAKLIVRYSDGTPGGKQVQALTATTWTETVRLLTVESDAVTQVKLLLKFKSPSGKLWLDDVSLTQGVIPPAARTLPLPGAAADARVLPLPPAAG